MNKTIRTGAPVALVLSLCALCIAQQQPTTRELRERLDDRESREDLLGQTRVRVLERMDQSTYRLKRDFDAGTTTQLIQERILEDLDKVIEEMAKRRREENDPKKRPGPDEPGVPGPNDPRRGDPRPGPVDDNFNQTPADKSGLTKADRNMKPTTELMQRGEAFLQVTPRLRQAVIEGATEQVSEKYRKMTEDYYKAVATAAKAR